MLGANRLKPIESTACILKGDNMRATDTLIPNSLAVEDSDQYKTVKTLFDQFTKELRYLRNLSERTIFSYGDAFERWLKFVGAMPIERNLSQFILGMREAGLSITTCNIYIRSINSFLTWLKDNGHCPQTFKNGKPFKLAKLPEEKKQLRVFDDSDIHKILSFKPALMNEWRIYALVCTLID